MFDHDDDLDEGRGKKAASRVPRDFDCPSCNANNPLEAPLRDRDEVLCHYCGSTFLVKLGDDGRARFKEL